MSKKNKHFVILYTQSLIKDEEIKQRVSCRGVIPSWRKAESVTPAHCIEEAKKDLRFGEVVGEEVIEGFPQYQVRYIVADGWQSKKEERDFCFTRRYKGKEYSPVRKTKVFEFEYFNKSVLLALASTTDRLEVDPKWTKAELISYLKSELTKMHNEIDKKTPEWEAENIKKLVTHLPSAALAEVFLKVYDMLSKEKKEEVERFLMESYWVFRVLGGSLKGFEWPLFPLAPPTGR